MSGYIFHISSAEVAIQWPPLCGVHTRPCPRSKAFHAELRVNIRSRKIENVGIYDQLCRDMGWDDLIGHGELPFRCFWSGKSVLTRREYRA